MPKSKWGEGKTPQYIIFNQNGDFIAGSSYKSASVVGQDELLKKLSEKAKSYPANVAQYTVFEVKQVCFEVKQPEPTPSLVTLGC